MKNQKALGSWCSICDKNDIPIKELSKTTPLGHRKEWLFWHEKNCEDNSQGSVNSVNVEYWDLIGFPKEKVMPDKIKLTDWNELTDILLKLVENKDETISRHAKGLLKALKL